MGVFAGTGRLVRLALRRDRILLPVSVLLLVLMTASGAPALANSLGSFEDQASYVTSAAPSIVGRIFQGTVQDISLGTIFMAETFVFASMLVALISMFIVTRHTRYNEETGAAELVGSTQVGRGSMLNAALIVAVGFNLVAAALMFSILATVEALDMKGSLMYSLSLAGIGIFFSGVAAVTSQLSDYRRGANGMAVGILVVFFAIRALGDALGDLSADAITVTASWISWLSPLGWGYQTLPYTQNRLFPLLMLIGGAVVLYGAAYLLLSHRDIGSSIFHAKSGDRRASASLLSRYGLTFKLHKNALFGWAAGYLIFGGMMAVVINDFRETFEQNELFNEFVSSGSTGGSFMDSAIAAMFPMIAAMLSAYAVTAAIRIQDEESSGRIEYLLGTALSRTKWLFTHVSLTIVGVFILLGLMGLAGGLGYSMVAEAGSTTSAVDIVLAALVNVPAMVLFFSVIMLVFSFGKMVKAFAWAFYAYIALIGSLVGIFSWPNWLSYASPFVHTPLYPTNDFDWFPMIIMSSLSVIVLFVTFLQFRHRDISLK